MDDDTKPEEAADTDGDIKELVAMADEELLGCARS